MMSDQLKVLDVRKHMLEKFRTRWRRWLGQKCRADKPYWTTLLQSNWMSWMGTILFRHNIRVSTGFIDRKKTKELYSKAISLANMKELGQLDNLYVMDNMSDR
jgi:hypothetical protein